MTERLTAVAGSFRDPANRVYRVDSHNSTRILRGLSAVASEEFKRLSVETFFKRAQERGWIVRTKALGSDDADAKAVLADGWTMVLEHEEVPFVSYPYEWSFSMLRDAALLTLSLLESAMKAGWTMKDGTPFNVQFIGARPVFIDIGSFEPRIDGVSWVGYRQFCSMFLTPLMARAHLGLDHLALMRAHLDGISPSEAAKLFRGTSRLKRGVASHVLLPARIESRILSQERDRKAAQIRKVRPQSDAMVLGLVQSLRRLVNRLPAPIDHTDWSHYDRTHSYEESDLAEKKAFVSKHASKHARGHVWDIGCNTGTFSMLCANNANQVIAIDGDHNAIEQLYLRRTEIKGDNILPLVMNLANPSPNQGWAGNERAAFDKRVKPDLVMALALIHHMRMSANVPNIRFLEWLRSLDCDVIIEFVNRHDEMVVKLLTNKKEQYEDYSLEQFREEVNSLFEIVDSRPLKGGDREIFMLRPKG
jgi:hypothetical protein